MFNQTAEKIYNSIYPVASRSTKKDFYRQHMKLCWDEIAEALRSAKLTTAKQRTIIVGKSRSGGLHGSEALWFGYRHAETGQLIHLNHVVASLIGVELDRFGWVVLPDQEEHTVTSIVSYMNSIGKLLTSSPCSLVARELTI